MPTLTIVGIPKSIPESEAVVQARESGAVVIDVPAIENWRRQYRRNSDAFPDPEIVSEVVWLFQTAYVRSADVVFVSEIRQTEASLIGTSTSGFCNIGYRVETRFPEPEESCGWRSATSSAILALKVAESSCYFFENYRKRDISLDEAEAVSHTEYYERTLPMDEEERKWAELVFLSIKGLRKGTVDRPSWEHSFRVSKMLRDAGYGRDVYLAGLLHDVVEDGGVTFEQLEAMGAGERLLKLVRYCTHDASEPDTFERWKKMMRTIRWAPREYSGDAFAIKLADIADNLTEAHLMPDHAAREKFLFRKGAYFAYWANEPDVSSEIRAKFSREWYLQVDRHFGGIFP